jgi:hypothetical protein
MLIFSICITNYNPILQCLLIILSHLIVNSVLFTYIHSLLIDEGFRECQNISINFPCALLCLSVFWRPLHILVRDIHFIPIFNYIYEIYPYFLLMSVNLEARSMWLLDSSMISIEMSINWFRLSQLVLYIILFSGLDDLGLLLRNLFEVCSIFTSGPSGTLQHCSRKPHVNLTDIVILAVCLLQWRGSRRQTSRTMISERLESSSLLLPPSSV